MTVGIRPATPADHQAIEQVENDADQLLIDRFSPARWEPAPTGASRAAEPGFLLVLEGGEQQGVIGFVHVITHGPLAHLEQLAVRVDHGRRGHGGRLVDAAKVEARNRGHRTLTLRTYADIPWNAPFYAKRGFVEVESRTEFHRELAAVEERLGLPAWGRRMLMEAVLR
ncbi:GNAT family N-acetyltransferase [Micrococcaceae bacterium RIT802]|nr:GNAT family N-acetyltransferase [Micrococcaceae bacterium RIT 802]